MDQTHKLNTIFFLYYVEFQYVVHILFQTELTL